MSATEIENCKRMLHNRNYSNIIEKKEDSGPILLAKDGSKKVMVKFLINQRLNISTVKQMISIFADEEINIGIIAQSGEPTSSAKTTLKNLDSSGKIRIQVFSLDCFNYCLPDHELVPRHQKLKKDESSDIKKRYGISKLPLILPSDPVVKYYAFKVGDILKITRKSGFISYRVVGT